MGLGLFSLLFAFLNIWTARAAAAQRTGVVKIGEYYDGHINNRWTDVVRNYSKPQPYPPKTLSWKSNATSLFVGIASFRDERCGRTLFNMYSQAAHPERVFSGVVQQNEPGDVQCIDRYCDMMAEANIIQLPADLSRAKSSNACPYRNNIRVLPVDAEDAAGPCWGRHLQYFMLRDEEFCMQTDSHMDYVKDWDVLMMREWAAAENEYAFLSTYVQSIDDLDKNINGHHEVSHLCEIIFTSQVRNQQAKALRLMTAPKLTSTWGAGYSFGKCHGERAVAYDPYLPQIFDGEEFSKFARLWTRGYDVYTPSRSYVGHDYNHLNAPHAQGWHNSPRHNKEAEIRASDKRLRTLLGMPEGSTDPAEIESVRYGTWGLGKKRSLEQLYEFIGVDLRTKRYINHPTQSCFTLDWVPFQETWPPIENVARKGPYLDMARLLLDQRGEWWEPTLAPPVPPPSRPHERRILPASASDVQIGANRNRGLAGGADAIESSEREKQFGGAYARARLGREAEAAAAAAPEGVSRLAAVGAVGVVVAVMCGMMMQSARKRGGAKGLCSLGLVAEDAIGKDV